MAATLMDAVRSSQQSNPVGRTSANTPSPSRRFDDVLASRRAERPEPKVEPREPEAKPKAAVKPREKAEDPDRTDDVAARSADDVEPTDHAPRADAAETADAAESDESSDGDDGTQKTRDGKAAGKTKDAKDAQDAKAAADAAAAAAGVDVVELSEAAVTAGLPAVADEAATAEKPVAETAGDADGGDETADPAAAAGAAALLGLNAAAVPIDGATPANDTSTTVGATGVQATDVGIDAAKATRTAATSPFAADAENTASAESAAANPDGGATLQPVAESEMNATAATNVAVPAELPKTTDKAIELDPAGEAVALQPAASQEKHAAQNLPPAADPNKATTPQRTAAEDNVDRIVTSVRGEMQKGGGTMEIRLDPPSLGQVQVSITIEDGVVSASLQTSNDEATRLLSHSLQQLKSTLESAGVMVDRIQVKQAAPSEQSSSNPNAGQDGDQRQQSGAFGDGSARQEQQRKEMLERMWAKVAGHGDPLDLVA